MPSAARFRGPMQRQVLCAAVIVIGLCLPAEGARALDVRHDLGGPVAERMERLRALEAQGTAVRIVGVCISACTLYLALPKACVTPDARLGFHGPTSRLAGIPLPRDEFERVSRQMAAHYPAPIRRWFLSEARFTTGGYHMLTGRQAIDMGARPC